MKTFPLLLLAFAASANATVIDLVNVSVRGTGIMTSCQGEASYCQQFLGLPYAGTLSNGAYFYPSAQTTFAPDGLGPNAFWNSPADGYARLTDTTWSAQSGDACPFADCATWSLQFAPNWDANMDLSTAASGTLTLRGGGGRYTRIVYAFTGTITVDTTAHWTANTQNTLDPLGPAAPVPEPSTLALLLCGAACISCRLRRRVGL